MWMVWNGVLRLSIHRGDLGKIDKVVVSLCQSCGLWRSGLRIVRLRWRWRWRDHVVVTLNRLHRPIVLVVHSCRISIWLRRLVASLLNVVISWSNLMRRRVNSPGT